MIRILFVALTSAKTAISDGFSDIFNAAKRVDNCYFFATSFSIDEVHPRVFDATYRRSWRSISKALGILSSLRSVVLRHEITDVVFYSTLPINGLLSRVLPSKTRVHWWLHDPHTHQGERSAFRIAKTVDDWLIRTNKRLVQVFVASQFLRKEAVAAGVKEPFLTVISFPYLGALVRMSGSRPVISGQNTGEQRIQLLFFGRIEAYKGLPWLLNALYNHGSDLAQRITVKIIGKGTLGFDLDRLRAKGFYIEFQNAYVSNDHLSQAISSAEVVLFPYRQATATQAIQSAGALGARVITTDVGSLPEAALAPHSRIVPSDDPIAFVDAIREEVDMKNRDRQEVAADYLRTYAPEVWVGAIIDAVTEHAR